MRSFMRCKIIIAAIGSLLAGCGSVDYHRCDPRRLNTIGYYRCSEAGIQRYLQTERQYLSELQIQEQQLSDTYQSQERQKQQLRRQLQALQAQTRQVVLKIQLLQKSAENAQHLSLSQQQQLSRQIDRAIEEYDQTGANIANALLLAKGVYDVTDTYRQIQESRRALRATRYLPLGRKILQFTRLTLPGFLIGLATDYLIIDPLLNHYLEKQN